MSSSIFRLKREAMQIPLLLLLLLYRRSSPLSNPFKSFHEQKFALKVEREKNLHIHFLFYIQNSKYEEKKTFYIKKLFCVTLTVIQCSNKK